MHPQELESRPKVLAHVRNDVDLKLKTANAWPESKPWINDTEREEVVTQVGVKGCDKLPSTRVPLLMIMLVMGHIMSAMGGGGRWV